MVNMTYGRSERVNQMHFQAWKIMKERRCSLCLLAYLFHYFLVVRIVFLAALLPCSIVPLFVCVCLFMFVCVCSFVCLFVCVFVCCFSPFAFIFAGLQFCFCSTKGFPFSCLFPMFSLCFLMLPSCMATTAGENWERRLKRTTAAAKRQIRLREMFVRQLWSQMDNWIQFFTCWGPGRD